MGAKSESLAEAVPASGEIPKVATKGTRMSQWFLVLLFLGIIVGIPLSQTIIEVYREERPRALEVFGRRPTAANLRAYEQTLEDASWAAKLFRPWIQYAQFQWLKDGGRKVLVGRDGWLFYKPGVEYLLGSVEGRKAGAT